ncbi:S8 family serine peptidase [Xylanibacter muris]|nr:S8 family serine peptidase [Xylanibacter muris]
MWALMSAVYIVARTENNRYKMSAYLREALCNGGIENVKYGGSGAVVREPARETRSVIAFVNIRSESADSHIGLFDKYDAEVLDARGDIFIVKMPMYLLDSICGEDAVRRIEAGRCCSVCLDSTALKMNIIPVYQGQSLPQAYTGKGVVMGLMDVGFDFTNPTFRTASEGGSAAESSPTRIKAVWDMLSADTAGSSRPVGAEYTGSDAILGYGSSADSKLQWHGSHTLGIAAGNGYITPYRGVAYDSDICLVSNVVTSDMPLVNAKDLYLYTSATDALGFKYIFDYAENCGRPCVISFSEGFPATYDHDDWLYQEYLKRITGPGRIIVASTGNEALMPTYLHKEAGKDVVGCGVYTGDMSQRILVKSDGKPFLVRFSDFTGNNPFVLCCDTLDNDSTVSVNFDFPSQDFKGNVSITRYYSPFMPEAATYMLTISHDKEHRADTRMRMSLENRIDGRCVEVEAMCVSASVKFYEEDGDAEYGHILHGPAYFDGVIGVGATVRRPVYRLITGEENRSLIEQGLVKKDWPLAYFSSYGPTADGRTKPDVVANGMVVISSDNSFFRESNKDEYYERNHLVAKTEFCGRVYDWHGAWGTSMSAPVVGGAIALWLEACPTLSPDDIIGILKATCNHPVEGYDYPMDCFGYGEIDVYKGLLYVLGLTDISGISANRPEGVDVRLSGRKLTVELPDGTGNVTATVYSLVGHKIMSENIISDGNCGVLNLERLAGGVYAVQFEGSGFVSGSVLIRVQ